jgi:hypothetical protein
VAAVPCLGEQGQGERERRYRIVTTMSAKRGHSTRRRGEMRCTALHWTGLDWTVLRCAVLYCTVLYCTALHCTVLHCTALHCTALRSTALHWLPTPLRSNSIQFNSIRFDSTRREASEAKRSNSQGDKRTPSDSATHGESVCVCVRVCVHSKRERERVRALIASTLTHSFTPPLARRRAPPLPSTHPTCPSGAHPAPSYSKQASSGAA